MSRLNNRCFKPQLCRVYRSWNGTPLRSLQQFWLDLCSKIKQLCSRLFCNVNELWRIVAQTSVCGMQIYHHFLPRIEPRRPFRRAICAPAIETIKYPDVVELVIQLPFIDRLMSGEKELADHRLRLPRWSRCECWSQTNGSDWFCWRVQSDSNWTLVAVVRCRISEFPLYQRWEFGKIYRSLTALALLDYSIRTKRKLATCLVISASSHPPLQYQFQTELWIASRSRLDWLVQLLSNDDDDGTT